VRRSPLHQVLVLHRQTWLIKLLDKMTLHNRHQTHNKIATFATLNFLRCFSQQLWGDSLMHSYASTILQVCILHNCLNPKNNNNDHKLQIFKLCCACALRKANSPLNWMVTVWCTAVSAWFRFQSHEFSKVTTIQVCCA
jgi:hypothetical protein